MAPQPKAIPGLSHYLHPCSPRPPYPGRPETMANAAPADTEHPGWRSGLQTLGSKRGGDTMGSREAVGKIAINSSSHVLSASCARHLTRVL